MFQSITPAPPDSILGLTEAFKADPTPGKINLGVGVYKDASGKTPVLTCVKEAERRILAAETSKDYKSIDGDAGYVAAVRKMAFGENSPLLAAKRVATAHTPSGTAALRVVADFLKQNHPGVPIWMSEPTWANHPQVFAAAGVPMKNYPYANADATGLDFDRMIDALKKIPAGEVVLLHGCCHNPSGIDPSPDQWKRIAEALAGSGALPMLDFAYQGFGDGVEEDAVGLRALCAACPELIVCTSYSKNFALYNERVGSVSFVAADAKATEAVLSRVKAAIRANYSNPPAHGGEIVRTILTDAGLRKQWLGELKQMRDRINGMRKLFAETMKAKAPGRDFSFITRQRGMFSFSGLNKDQVESLRQKHAIYIIGNGRINVAGMTEDNMGPLCDAIAGVL